MFTRRFVSFPLRGGVSCAQLTGSRGVGSSMDWDAILAAVPNDLAAADGDAEAVAGPGPGAAATNPAVAASAPRRLGIFLGALNRSKAHMVFVRSAKDLKRAAAQSENCRHAFSGLKRAWDGQCVRVGDSAAGPEDVCEQRHMNQYLSEAVLRLAYRGVGKGGGGVVGRDGFDGTHSAMPLMCGVASASLNSQTEAMGKWWREFQTEADSKGALVVNVHYDTTPWRVGLGVFFDLFAPTRALRDQRLHDEPVHISPTRGLREDVP